MMTNDVRAETVQLLEASGSKILRVSPIQTPPKLLATMRSKDALKLSQTTWRHVFTKYLVFSLTDYEQVAFIDSDAFLIDGLRSPLQLFESCSGTLCAVQDNSLTTPVGNAMLNSGVLVVRPDAARFKRLLSSLRTYTWHPNTTTTDQVFLSDHFAHGNEGGVRFMSARYNFGCTPLGSEKLGFEPGEEMPAILHICGAFKIMHYPICDAELPGPWPCNSGMGRMLQTLMQDANPCLPFQDQGSCSTAQPPALRPIRSGRGAQVCHWCGSDIGCHPRDRMCLLNTDATRAQIARMREEEKRRQLGRKEFEDL